MSCNDPYFQALLGCVRDTWAKPLLQNKYKNISWWSYTACDKKHPYPHIDFENHMIYVDSGDDLYSTYDKTKKAYELIKSTGIDFNYVVRTNTSIFVNIKNMLKRIDEMDENTIIGTWQKFKINNIPLYWGVIGYFFIMRKEHFEIIISSDDCLIADENGNNKEYWDDVVFAKNLSIIEPDIKGICAEEDDKVFVYKGALKDEDIPEIFKLYSNFINVLNPKHINDRVIIRLKGFNDDINVRKEKGHEIEHFYELNDALN